MAANLTIRARGSGNVLVGAMPVTTSPLFGRERDLAALVGLMLERRQRLVTITGPGGVGKTRLALAAIAEVEGRLPALFLPLAAVDDASLIPASIARAFGVTDSGEQSLAVRIGRALGQDSLLLVLDNFEHVVMAGAIVGELLAHVPGLQVLVTSREPLRVRGEQELPIDPLPLTGAAISLFVERAREARPGFTLTDESAVTVAEICRRLDGLPLAIELAAARTRLLTPNALLGRLERRLQLLTHGPRDVPQRLQTMRDAIAWSYDLLDGDEQRLYRSLSVFAGGFTYEAAEAVTGLEGDASLLDGLGSLVEKNLIRASDTGSTAGEPRYEMLETIREFALEQLAANNEADDVRDRHALWFRDLTTRSIPELTGPGRGPWIARLEADYANIRAVLGWAEQRGNAELMMKLVEGCWRFWEPRGYLAEGAELVERALRIPGEVPPQLHASVLYGGSVVSYRQGAYVTARKRVKESLAICRQIGDSAGVATALNGLGNIAYEGGDLESARAAHQEALTIRRVVAPSSVAISLTNLAVVLFDLGDDTSARACYEEALELRRAVEDPNGIAFALNGLGMIAARQGNHSVAASYFEAAIALRRGQDSGHLAASLAGFAAVKRDRGDAQGATELFRQALTLRWERGERRGAASVLVGLAEVASDAGDSDLAVKLIGAASAMRQEIGTQQSAPDQERENRTLAAARTKSAEGYVDDLLAKGRSMPSAEAVSSAMTFALIEPAPEMPVVPAGVAMLTPRELDVLKLLAEGLSDREIGAKLSISPATASRHVNNIYLKLEVNSRTTAAKIAFQNGLV